jgi:hypothetical protein
MEQQTQVSKAFVKSLLVAADIEIPVDGRLVCYVCATYGLGIFEAFAVSHAGTVTMVTPNHKVYDVVLADWATRHGVSNDLTYDEWLRNKSAAKDGAWTWGWIDYRNSELFEAHFFDSSLIEADIVGPNHSLKWRKGQFGNTEIIYPSHNAITGEKRSFYAISKLNEERVELNDVTSFEKAEQLFHEGALFKVLLIPPEFNGRSSDANTVYLPKSASNAKDQVTESLLKLKREGQITSLDMQLVYKGNSVVPTEIVMKSWHKERLGEFTNTIKVW